MLLLYVETYGPDINMSMILDFIDFLLQIVFWYFIGSLLIKVAFRLLTTNNTANDKSAIDELRRKTHVISQEKIGDMYYWYDVETKEFLVQGANTEEIVSKIKKYFMGHIFIAENYAFTAPDYTPKPLGKVATIVG